MKLIKGIGYLLLFLSAALMLLLFVCAWKPELTDEIAELLYEDGILKEIGTDSKEPDEPEQEVLSVSDSDNDLDLGTSDFNSRDDDPQDSDKEKNAAANETDREKEPDAGSGTGAGAEMYIPPEREQLIIPKETDGKNGLLQIAGTDSEISDEEAGDLRKRLDAGETGDGLFFDPLYYPYYEMLDEQGQHLYRQIYANAKALNQAFSPVEPIKARQLKDIFSAVYNDHPELFWVDTAYSCRHMRNGDCVEIGLSFYRTAKNLTQESAEFERAAEEILSAARGLSNDYDKERYVHDMLIRSIDYVKSAEMNQSAYSALVGGRTVCAGYARAFQYLLQQLQIPCYYCTGFAGEDHAWNIVKLGDGFYNVDVTWDDNDAGKCEYFNKTDEDYADTHIREDLSVYLPPCTGVLYRSEETADGKESGKRTSQEAGFTEEELLHSMEEYYAACKERMLQNGRGEYSFDLVLDGKELYAEWEKAYNENEYKKSYMENAMRKIGAKTCHIQLITEELQQDRYLITHELQLR